MKLLPIAKFTITRHYHKLTFNEHVENICVKGNKKLHALAWISNYMHQDKLRTIMKAFFNFILSIPLDVSWQKT